MTVAIVVSPFGGSFEAAAGCTDEADEWMGPASDTAKVESARPRAQPLRPGPHRIE
jgi:hypothetical protein